MKRIANTFARLKHEQRSGLACYFTAGDPDYSASLELLGGLAAAGADLIELGIPFSDPVADGAAIQAAHIRARAAGQTVTRTLAMLKDLRKTDSMTPIVLMGYLNPVLQYGETFFHDAALAGADGLILVDLPYEHSTPYAQAAETAGLALIPMSAPTCSDERLDKIVQRGSGFIYHVSLNGTTGAACCAPAEVSKTVARIRARSALPIATGFGIRSVDQIRALDGVVDLIVVGSHLVAMFAERGLKATLNEVHALAAPLHIKG